MALDLLARSRGDLAPSARTAYGSFPVLSARWRLIGKDSNGSTWSVRQAVAEWPVLCRFLDAGNNEILRTRAGVPLTPPH